MKKNFFIVSVLLILIISSFAHAQQIGNIAEIEGSIKVLEDIENNPDISEAAKQKYRLSLVKKRGQLATLLEEQSEELQAQRKKGGNAEEIAKIDVQIKEIDIKINKLLQNNVTNVEFQSVVAPIVDNNSMQTVSQPVPITPVKNPQSITNTGNSNSNTAQNTNTPQNQTSTTPVKDRYTKQVRIVAKNISQDKLNNPNATINEQRDLGELLLLALAAKKGIPSTKELTAQAENTRNDKQTGSSSSRSGSTSLVTKGAVPAIFGFAVENGALERTTSGTTITFRGNPVGIIEAIRRKDYIDSYQSDSGFDRILRNFAFGLSFDTSRGNANGAFTGDKQQLSAFSLRYNFINQRDPRDKRYTALWKGLVNEQAVNVVNLIGQLNEDWIFPDKNKGQKRSPWLDDWIAETSEIIKNAKSDEVEAKLLIQLEKIQNVPSSSLGPELETLIEAFGTTYTGYLKERDKILGQIQEGWLVTLEYTNNRPVDSSSISNLNFIAEKGAKKGVADLTFNASLSFYNKKPTGMNTKRLRDFNISGQLDIPLNGINGEGVWLLTFAGKYKRLLEDEPIPNTMEVIKKGDVGVFQAKLVIPIPKTAFKIPISVSFANRTELIKEREVRANFGFTFDIDSILARLNPFNK